MSTGMHEETPYAEIPSQERLYPLRDLFQRYRDNGGACWVEANPEELSVVQAEGEITCMARCCFQLGHPHNGVYVGPHPEVHRNPRRALETAMSWLSKSIDSGYLWCLEDSFKYVRAASGWRCDAEDAEALVSDLMHEVDLLPFNPLRVSVVHSALESDKIRHSKCYGDLYPYPRTTVPSSGLFGTDHNNHAIDMSPFEKDKEPDLEQREFRRDHVGFVCPTYTSHSYEAGRSKRLAEDTSVRLLCYDTYRILEMIQERLPGEPEDGSEGDWVVCCAGQFFRVSGGVVREVCVLHRLMSIHSDSGIGLYMSLEKKVCVIGIGSGVVTKKCTNGVWADSCNAYSSDITEFTVRPQIATSGPDFHRACLSGYFSYIPFVEHNAAVRTSISSAQTLQAVCLPYCPATAAVSPCNVFQPLVVTPRYKRIMALQENSLDLASYMPGENLCVLYHNLPLNFEDSTFISKRYVDNGGFSTISMCRYSLPATDYVPEIGQEVCSVLSPWWKSPCQKTCVHEKDCPQGARRLSPFGSPTGVVVSKKILASGTQSVKVRSFEQFQAGNKVSTGHGQKGVASAIVPYEDMPICIMENGTQVIPDIVIGVSSIVSRQTLGQVYESVAGLNRLRNPEANWVVLADETVDLSECSEVYDGGTGERYRTLVRKSCDERAMELRPTFATVGYLRVFNQSQMTRERHFTSHRSMRSGTLRTPVKRSRGGAVRAGEMEVQAAVAAGLPQCVKELRRRGDEVVVHLCTACQRLRLLHSCTSKTTFVELTLPYDTVVLDCVNKIVYNCAFKYEYSPDV